MTVRLSSQELADRVRQGMRVGPLPTLRRERETLDAAHDALDVLAARLQATEQALADDDAIMAGVAAVRKMLRMRVAGKHDHAEAFRRALEGAAE